MWTLEFTCKLADKQEFYPKIKNVPEMTQYGKNTLKYWHFFPAMIIFFQIMHISLKDVNLNVFDSQEITLQAKSVIWILILILTNVFNMVVGSHMTNNTFLKRNTFTIENIQMIIFLTLKKEPVLMKIIRKGINQT